MADLDIDIARITQPHIEHPDFDKICARAREVAQRAVDDLVSQIQDNDDDDKPTVNVEAAARQNLSKVVDKIVAGTSRSPVPSIIELKNIFTTGSVTGGVTGGSAGADGGGSVGGVVGGRSGGATSAGDSSAAAAGGVSAEIAVPVTTSTGLIVDADTAMKELVITNDGPIASTAPQDPNYHAVYAQNPGRYRLLGTHMDSSFKQIDSPQERALLKTIIVQLLMHPEGTVFDPHGQHEIPKTLAKPTEDATEQPRSEALSVISTMDMNLPVSDSSRPVQYQQWLLYAMMQFGKTKSTLLSNYVLHATKAIIPAILLENRNSTESQRKFIMDMRELVSNVRRLASWILARDRHSEWVAGRRCFPDIVEQRFLAKLDLKLRAKTLKLEDLTGCPRQALSEDEAKHHVGILEIETESVHDPTTGKNRYVRRLKGGENQGVVMLCNRTNVEQLLGVMTSGKMKYEGLISVLIGQSKKMTVGALQGRGGTEVIVESAYTPYAKSFSRLLISIDEAGTLFGSKDKMKKSEFLFDSDQLGEKLMDELQNEIEFKGGTELTHAFNESHRKRELYKDAMDKEDDEEREESDEDDERAQRARRRSNGDRDEDDISMVSVRDDDDDDDEEGARSVIDPAELNEKEALELEQAKAMMLILERVSCAGSAVFGIFMVDATPFRTVLDRDLNRMATTSTRVLQPQANPSYIGFSVKGSPQESNPFHIITKIVAQPSTTRRASDGLMRLLFLEANQLARRRPNGDFEVLSTCFKYERASEGDVLTGEPAAELKLNLAKSLRVAEGVDRKMLQKDPKDPRLPRNIPDRYNKPATWNDDVDGMTFEDFANAVHHPDSGMHAYVAAVKEHNRLQPQQNEYQRLEPALTQVLQDWDSPARDKATGLHLLWATTDSKTSNYELFYLLRNMLSQQPLAAVEHVHGVLFNGGGTALQVVVPKPRYDAGESPTAMDLFNLLQRDEFRLLWQKRITNAEKIGVGKKRQDGPCFKVPVTFSKRYRNQALAGKRPAFLHTDVPAIQYPVLDKNGEEDLSKRDEELEEKLRKAKCETGEDTGIYVCEFEDRVILMFVSRESDISAILSLDCAVYECKIGNWQPALGSKPIHKTVTMQSTGLSRGQSVKTVEHGHPVTDLIRNKPFEPSSSKISAQMTLDEEAQALGRLCELRFCVPPEVLRECGPGQMFESRGYHDPIHGPYRWACDNRKYAWLNENYQTMMLTSMAGTQQLMNCLEIDATHHASTEAAAAAAIAATAREAETDALYSMLKSPLCYKHSSVKTCDPEGGVTASGRARMIRTPTVEPIYLPLGGAPRLTQAMREMVVEQVHVQPAATRRAEPPALPIQSYMRQEEERAADRLRAAHQPGVDVVQSLRQENANIRAEREQAEHQMKQHEKYEREERAKAKRDALIRSSLRLPTQVQSEIEHVLSGFVALRRRYEMLMKEHVHDRDGHQTSDRLARLGIAAKAIVLLIEKQEMPPMTAAEFTRLDDRAIGDALRKSSFKPATIPGALSAWREFKALEKLDKLDVDVRVRVHGLKSAPEFNGRLGTITRKAENNRFEVDLDGEQQRQCIKAICLETLSDTSDVDMDDAPPAPAAASAAGPSVGNPRVASFTAAGSGVAPPLQRQGSNLAFPNDALQILGLSSVPPTVEVLNQHKGDLERQLNAQHASGHIATEDASAYSNMIHSAHAKVLTYLLRIGNK